MAEQKISGPAKGALVAAAALVLAAVAIGDSSVAVAAGVVVTVLVIFVMTQVPLRYSLMTLMFFAFTLENPDEGVAMGLWSSPFSTVGAAMLIHLNAIDRKIGFLSWCSFSGMDICIVTLLLVALQRKNSGSKIDGGGTRVTTPKPLLQLAYVSLLGVLFVWVSGLLRGGEFGMSLWQVNRVVYLPVLFILFQMGFRGPRDNVTLAKVVLYAATFRALLAIYIVATVNAPLDDDGKSTLVYATTHADSMLFAIAVVLCASTLLERVPRTTKRNCIILLAIICAGIVENGRRMAWVQVAIVLLTVYRISAESPLKRKVRKIMPYAASVFAVYAMIGWGSKAAIFKPVAMMKSVVEPQTDSSSLWREIENYDIISTFRMNPIFGSGYGHPYIEFIHLDAVDYPLEHYAPHNGILGLWAFCGYVGFTAITLLWTAGVYFAIRAHKAAKEPYHRVGAIASFGAVLIYLIQCWGDVGLGSWTGVFIAAPGLAAAGKLAMANGQWGSVKGRAAAVAARDRATGGVPRPEQAA